MNAAASLAVVAIAVIAAGAASGHAVLYKRDDRGTMMWLGLIWALPVVGPALYLGFGINRVKRRATFLRRRFESGRMVAGAGFTPRNYAVAAPPAGAEHLAPLIEVTKRVTGQDLLTGNQIDPLFGAAVAYPAMIGAIAEAKHTISLSTYIFDHDETGLEFVTALGAAVGRGVAVRVLIDATGTFFTRHSVGPELRRRGVNFARFLPAISMGEPMSLNLRTHRKLLVVDGRVGFTGGMNLCLPQLRTKKPPQSVMDTHFCLRGPIIAHLQQTFVEDWQFTTGESLTGSKWFPCLQPAGAMLARGIADGPDEDLEKTRWTLLGAISTARYSLRILTPYFLPDASLISALNVAAMRGVEVEVLLPTDGDVPFVQWASEAHWWQLLQHGCRIWVAPPPFDHSKLFIVDDAWVLLGSSNWDPRSLRLNFEFNFECYDAGLAQVLGTVFDERRRRAREVSLQDVNDRPLCVRLRDGISRLATPFL